MLNIETIITFENKNLKHNKLGVPIKVIQHF